MLKTIPIHVAIIMDGNRRWAKKNRLKMPFIAGHKFASSHVIEPLVDKAIELGIVYLTFWAFSTENWQRDKIEVRGMLALFRENLKKNVSKLHKKGVRFMVIGDTSKFPKDISEKIKEGLDLTKQNKKIKVIFALNYGGRDEILRAINKLLVRLKASTHARASADKQSSRFKIDGKLFASYLDTAAIPDPDLIIRTGGEKRLSGFLLWQAAYSELYFTATLFPDFTPAEFEKAITKFVKRQRRLGR